MKIVSSKIISIKNDAGNCCEKNCSLTNFQYLQMQRENLPCDPLYWQNISFCNKFPDNLQPNCNEQKSTHKEQNYIYDLTQKHNEQNGAQISELLGINEIESDTIAQILSSKQGSKDSIDSKLYETAEIFYKKLIKSEGKYYTKKHLKIKAAELAAATVNDSNGEISLLALDFINKYCFKQISFNKLLYKAKALFGKTKVNFLDGNAVTYEHNQLQLLKHMKNNQGDFDATNVQCMSQLISQNRITGDFGFFELLKDDNGVVAKDKFELFLKVLKETGDTKTAAKMLEIKSACGDDIFKQAYDIAKEFAHNSDFSPFDFVETIVQNCFDENNSPKIQQIKNAQQIVNKYGAGVIFVKQFFNVSQDDFYKNETLNSKFRKREITQIIELFALMKELTSNFDFATKFEIQQGVKKSLLSSVSYSKLEYLFTGCFNMDKSNEIHFDRNTFYNIVDLIQYFSQTHMPARQKLQDVLNVTDLLAIAKEDMNSENFKLNSKIELIDLLEKNGILQSDKNDRAALLFKKLYTELNSGLLNQVRLNYVNKCDTDKFARAIFQKNISQGYSRFDEVLVRAIPKLESMTFAMPLEYTRKQFLADLSALCTDEKKRKIIENKLNLSEVYYKNNGKNIQITGYEGFITLDKLDTKDPFEKKVYDLCHRFLYENRISTCDTELDNLLNMIIKAVPEFINTIGKPQSGTHKYTLDVHQILALAYSISNPDYQKLNDTDKAVLKIATLFHDIAKYEGIKDKGHMLLSCVYAREIMKKFTQDMSFVKRVQELVKNHHWLEEYHASKDKEAQAAKIAFKFRRNHDFEIAKIMTKADIQSNARYKVYEKSLEECNLSSVQNRINALHASGSAIFTDGIINPQKLKDKKVKIGNKYYAVVDLRDIDDNESLIQYGFKDVKKKNAVFLVHMLPDENIKDKLNAVQQLQNPLNGGVLSESLITPHYRKTFQDRNFGLLMLQDNDDIISMSTVDQGSGTTKDISIIVRNLFSRRVIDNRKNFRIAFLKNLLFVNAEDVTDSDYAEFYKKYIANAGSLANFKDYKEYSIGKFKVSGAEIKNAIIKYQKDLINKEEKVHNEIIGYCPKINAVVVKAEGLERIPKSLLDFAYENDYPILII